MAQQLPAVIVITPLIISFVVFLSGWWDKRVAYPLAMAAMTVCLLFSASILNTVMDGNEVRYFIGGWPPPWGIEYRVDPLSAFILCLNSSFGFIAAVYAKKSVEKELPEKTFLFWSLYLLLMTGLLGIGITGDMFNLFVLLEVASLSGYALVGIGKGKAAVAGFRYLIIGTIGASFYLLGVGYLYISTGTLNMQDLQTLLPPIYTSRVIQAAFVFIFIGVAIKLALFPLHAWQPDAYTYSPSAVSVIISTAMAKTFCYVLVRVLFSVFTLDFLNALSPLLDIICWFSVIAMIAGSIYAIFQYNLKRMLAYSSVANVGYIVLAIGLAPSTSLGLTPAIMHILNHAVIKGGMFMAACAFIHKLGLWDIRSFTGLGRKMPYTCLVFILAALSMIGLPPGAGFVSKWYLILAALDAGRYLFVFLIFISTLLMIVYFWRVIEIMFIRVDRDRDKPSNLRVEEAPLSMLLPGLFLAVISFAIGVVWISGVFAPFLNSVNASLGLGGGP